MSHSFAGKLPIEPWRLPAFAAGLVTIWIALGSPLASLDHMWLSAHMTQHLLLMALGAPLILLGAPAVLLRYDASRPALRVVGLALSHPSICWLVGTLAVIGWHVPAAFELAMHSYLWRVVQHATFVGAGILFWLPVIPPWPRVTCMDRWAVPLYLFLGTLPCDALSAFLTFSGRVVYPSYLTGLAPSALVALRDQETAGALMWVCVTFIYLLPAIVITVRLLSNSEYETRRH